MARSMSSPLQKLEKQLTCPVCLELYKNPKALTCQHNFCLDCLVPCPREYRKGKYFLNCPTCRMAVQLPDGGVHALPPAFTINSFLELHQEMLAKEGGMECLQHKKPLEAYCERCQELVCFTCTTRSHSNHRVQQIADIIDNCKQELEEGTQPVKQQVAIFADAIKDLSACDEAIARQGEAMEQQIHSQAQEVRNAVDQEERKLIQKVRTAVLQKRAVIGLQKQEAQEELARLQSSIEIMEQSVKVQSDQQIVASKAKLLDRMKASISRARNFKLQPAEKPDLGYERNQKAAKDCKWLGMLRGSHISQKCQLSLQPITPDRAAHCQLSVKDSDGSPFPISTSLISCQLNARSGPQPADCTIMEMGPGLYEISSAPVICGPHHLRVMVGGVDIPGSVFSVPLLPPSPETRGRPLHTIFGVRGPYYIAVSSRGQVVVSEAGADCVGIFSSELQQIMSVGSKGVDAYNFNEPAGVAITGDGRVLVADSANHRVQALTMEGRFLASVGSEGKGRLQFHLPTSVVVHPNGQVLISEVSTNRIQVLNQDLSFSHSFTTHGSPRGVGEGHYDMAVDSHGVIYVTDPREGCVQKFSISGQFIGQFGSSGSAQGMMGRPFGIAIDDKDYVYISEPTLERISIFTSKGKFIHCFHTRDEDEDSFMKKKDQVFALAFDKYGNLYACKPVKGQVVVF